MKTTEFIRMLQAKVDEVGDKDIATENPMLGYVQEIEGLSHDDNHIIIQMTL